MLLAVDDGVEVLARPRLAPREHLVPHQAERVDVAPAVQVTTVDLLRGHVGRRPQGHPGKRQVRIGIPGPRDTEVREASCIGLLVHVDVLGLDVPVDDPATMGIGEGSAHVHKNVAGLRAGEWPLCANQVFQAPARDVLHDEREAVVLELLRPVEHDDVGVLQARDRPGLPHQAGHGLLVLHERRADNLDRHVPLELLVPSQIDDRSPATTQLPDDLVLITQTAQVRKRAFPFCHQVIQYRKTTSPISMRSPSSKAFWASSPAPRG